MRLAAITLAGLILLGAAGPAAAQDTVNRFVGRPVTTLTITLDGQAAPSDVASLVTIQTGQPLSLDAVMLSVRNLIIVGHYLTATVDGTPSGDGVAVAVAVVARKPVDGLAFTGDLGLSEKELKGLVDEQYGVLPSTARPEAVARTVQTLLFDEGFLGATATASLADDPAHPGRALVVVALKAGPRAMIRNVEVTGTSSLSTRQIETETGALPGSPYRQRAIDDALLKLKIRLRSQDYYQAEAVVTDWKPLETGTVGDLDLHVDAGPLVLGPFFTGDPPPAGNVNDLVPMKLEQSVSDDLLDDARTRIEAYLRRDGYEHASAPYTKTQTDRGLVVSFAITRGPLYRVGTLNVKGNGSLTLDAVRRLLGVAPGDPYWLQKLQVGVLQLDADYLKRGFYQEQATHTESEPVQAADGSWRVDVELAITEGPQATVTDITFSPLAPHVPVATLQAAMREKRDQPYVRVLAGLDQATIETLYHNRGFPDAKATITPDMSADHRSATLTVTIDEGNQVFVQDVRVIGNHRVDSPAILDAMPLKAGAPVGDAELQKSRQDIQETFAFRSVLITPEPVVNDPTHVHLVVTVEEAPATTIAWGGGLLVDRRLVANAEGAATQQLDLGPRGSFEITRQNVGGRNRTVDFFSQVGVRSDPNSTDNAFGFVEYLVRAQYVEHRFFQTNMDLTFSGGTQRDVQTDFNFLKQFMHATLSYRTSPHLSLTGEYGLDFTKLFEFNQSIPSDQILQIDRVFSQVRLSTFTTSLLYDRRNNPVTPSSGTITNASFEVAPKAIGSQVGFVKGQFQISAYRAIDQSRRFVGAGRVWLGLAHGFDPQPLLDPVGNAVLDANGKPIIVAEVPASERFFAGGASTVRGFNQDVLGVPSIITNDGFSLGGNGLVILNLELRTRVTRVAGHDFGVVTFIDGGNVFPNASNVNLSQLRGTLGVGARYDSPLGPIRLDFGFKVSRMTFGTSNTLEPGWTWHLSVGEAF